MVEKWKKIHNKFDNFLNDLANFILIVLAIVLLYAIVWKYEAGKIMMYEDYYDKHVNEQKK